MENVEAINIKKKWYDQVSLNVSGFNLKKLTLIYVCFNKF